MRDLKLAGRTNEAGVMQSEANYYNILGSITDLEASVDRLNNTMSLLLNTMPQEWAVSENAVLLAPENARNGVAMATLAARPDVAAAEQSLAQAYYATNSARAAFYPALPSRLTAVSPTRLARPSSTPATGLYSWPAHWWHPSSRAVATSQTLRQPKLRSKRP